MIFELAQDFYDAVQAMPREHPKHRMLELLEEAIRRDIHFIDRHPTTLFQCMWNTCWWYDCPEAEAHYENPEGGWSELPPWGQKGLNLCALLQTWRTGRAAAVPGVPWLRAIRPPGVSLGAGQRMLLRNQKREVWSLACSPDGCRIASGWEDGTIDIWDAASGEMLLRLCGHTGKVLCLSYSPDGRWIVSGAADRTVRVWDAVTGMETISLQGHDGHILTVAYSHDGSRILAGGTDRALHIWDGETGKHLKCLRAYRSSVRRIAFSSNDRWLAVGSEWGTIDVWDLAAPKIVRSIRFDETPREDDAVLDLYWFPCDSWLGTITEEHKMQVWNVLTGQRLYSVQIPHNWLLSLAWSPDGRRAVSAGAGDTRIRIWDTITGDELGQLYGHTDVVQCVSYSPTGRFIISGGQDGTIRVWHAEHRNSWQSVKGHRCPIIRVMCTSDGERFVTHSSSFGCPEDDDSVCVWDSVTGIRLFCLGGIEGAINGVAVSPIGQGIAVAIGGEVHIWDATTGAEMQRIDTGQDDICGLTFSPSGERIAVAVMDASLRIWDLVAGEEVLCLRGHDGPAWSVAWSPDGRKIASASAGMIRIWNALTGEQLGCIQMEAGRMGSISWSPNGSSVTLRDDLGGYREWDTETGIRHAERTHEAALSLGGSDYPYAQVCVLPSLGETLVAQANGGAVVAWFTDELHEWAAHPFLNKWAASVHSHLQIVQLETREVP